jgi:hypothetical protein
MKARVKETGEIIDVRDCGSVFYEGALFHGYVDINRNKYLPNDLEFDGIDGTPTDYWIRLEHQYAGMAMQGMLVSHRINSILENGDVIPTGIAMLSRYFAHALVEKLKEKEERK